MDPATDRSRRSHLARQVKAKRVRITDADIRDIFEPLARHRRLTTRQLVALGARYPTITKARLGALWHGTEGERSHWLHRVNEDILFANHLTVEDMHRLGQEAEALLIHKQIIPAEEWVANSRIGGASAAPSKIMRLAHDHMASEIALDIEIGARKAGVPFRTHIDILRDAPLSTRMLNKPLKIPVSLNGQRTFVEPDALFGVNGRNFALEADKGTESVKGVIVPKILAYREIVAAGIIDDHLGIDNLWVLFATTSEKRMRNVMDELASIARNGKSTMFGFRADAVFRGFLKSPPPTGALFTSPWARVGHPDLILAEVSRK
jgi:protein involved in plasmid replication-relaxation